MRLPFTTLTARHALLMSLAAVHLLLVLSSALGLRPLQVLGSLGSIGQVYAAWSGASSQFSFFAPGVSPAVRVSFRAERESGGEIRDDFRFDSAAMNLRIHSMLLRFGLKDVQDPLARSWAAAMFGRHPDARSVTVRVEALRLPSMEAYRAGDRPEWMDAYRAVFEHRAPVSEPQTGVGAP
ncbi:hypothetical protein DRW03_03160 [Corallococcus sp. H22C18031201]|uniref:hypothetical protein n=1 Tax=Citreicoccus inhibens TaxID=2849499 RepID=UPI000E767282|nr:hypothetical protein [Citreicoccus inhibens]MBU8899641.1 hypothetical protein [Citreicoccus inhibens]RJS27380.1 hypothetical protein DRW03_03160 [Corallococcus sp. H22C18031201]